MEFSEKVRKEIEKYDSINMVFPYPVGSKVYVVNYHGRDINFNVISTSSYDIPTTYFSQQYEAAKLSNADFVWLSQESRSMELVVQEAFENTLHFRYGQECLKTWNMDCAPHVQISNAVLGIVGEMIEVEEVYEDFYNLDRKNLMLDELGDVMYYRAIFCMLMGDTLENYSSYEKSSLSNSIKLLSDVAKKVTYHGKWQTEKTMSRYDTGMFALDGWIIDMLSCYDFSRRDVYEFKLLVSKMKGLI